ncbi:MAG: hypothetical protein NTW28_15940 [Candidatus Solibacter sp.]|nr:hypothetical protein [Candidatus Solibacter sp.]
MKLGRFPCSTVLAAPFFEKAPAPFSARVPALCFVFYTGSLSPYSEADLAAAVLEKYAPNVDAVRQWVDRVSRLSSGGSDTGRFVAAQIILKAGAEMRKVYMERVQARAFIDLGVEGIFAFMPY